jgi:hypothetical protein
MTRLPSLTTLNSNASRLLTRQNRYAQPIKQLSWQHPIRDRAIAARNWP